MKRTSFSQISTWLRCGRLYRFRYIDRAPPERISLALPFGSAFHDAIQWHVQRRKEGQVPSADQVHAAFVEMLHARLDLAEAPVEGDVAEAETQARAMIDAYLASDGIQDVQSTESHHVVPLASDLEIEGYVDFVAGSNGTGREIVELKTSSRVWSQEQVDLSLQAAAYTVLTGIPSIRFVVVTKAKAPKVQALRTHVDADRVGRLRETVLEVEDGIEAMSFPRNPSTQNCSGCEFRNRCLNGGR